MIQYLYCIICVRLFCDVQCILTWLRIIPFPYTGRIIAIAMHVGSNIAFLGIQHDMTECGFTDAHVWIH